MDSFWFVDIPTLMGYYWVRLPLVNSAVGRNLYSLEVLDLSYVEVTRIGLFE